VHASTSQIGGTDDKSHPDGRRPFARTCPSRLRPGRGRWWGCADVTSGRSAAVDLKGLCIFPTLVRVPSGGGEVTFTNYDEVNHVVVGAGFAWGSDGIMHQGDSFTAHFTRDGVYPFSVTCIRGCRARSSWGMPTREEPHPPAV
jgi:hypothetical protein